MMAQNECELIEIYLEIQTSWFCIEINDHSMQRFSSDSIQSI